MHKLTIQMIDTLKVQLSVSWYGNFWMLEDFSRRVRLPIDLSKESNPSTKVIHGNMLANIN